MATYPQGITSFIPTYQAYQPNWNVLAQVQKFKQTAYDQNWQKLNNIYSRLYNADVSNPNSEEIKSGILKEIDFNVHRTTGLDLSLQQNVVQAQQIFKPFYQNANLMADVAKTNQYKAAMGLGQSYRTSKNKEERDMYWGGGFEYLNNKMDEFKKLDFNQLSGAEGFSYVPYVNVNKLMEEVSKDMGDMDIERKNGRYIVKDVNGTQMVSSLQDVFYNRIGSDPRVKDVYSVLEYNKRKNDIRGIVSDNPNMSESEAELQYLQGKLPTLKSSNLKNQVRLEDRNKVLTKTVKELEASIKNGSDKPGSEAALIDAKQALQANAMQLETVSNDLELLDGDADNVTLLTNGSQDIDYNSVDDLRNRVIGANRNSMLFSDLDAGAFRYSKRNMKREIKADPYAKIDYEKASSIAAHKQKGVFDAFLKAGYIYDEATGDFQYYPYLDQSTKDKVKKVQGSKNAIDKGVIKLKKDLGLLDEKVVTDASGKEQVVLVPNAQANYIQFNPQMMVQDNFVDTEDVMEEIELVMDASAKKGTVDKVSSTLAELYNNNHITAEDVGYVLHGGVEEEPFKDLPSPLKIHATGKRNNSFNVKEYIGENSLASQLKKQSVAGADSETVNGIIANIKDNMGNYTPTQFARIVNRLYETVEPLQKLPSVQNDVLPKMSGLDDAHFQLEDWISYKGEIDNFYAERGKAIKARMIQDGFNPMYIDDYFDARGRERTGAEFTAAIFKNHADMLVEKEILPSKSTWSSKINKGLVAGTAAAGVTIYAGQMGPQLMFPEEIITAPIAFVGAFLLGASEDQVEGAISSALDEGDYGEGSGRFIKNPMMDGKTYREFNSWKTSIDDMYDRLTDNLEEHRDELQDITVPVVGMIPSGIPGGQGKFTSGTSSVKIIPGATSFPNTVFKTEINPILEKVVKDQKEVGEYFMDEDDYSKMVMYSTKGITLGEIFDSQLGGTMQFMGGSTADMGEDVEDVDMLNEAAPIFKSVYLDLVDNINNNKGVPYDNMKVYVSPIAGGQFEKIGITIKPDDKYIKAKYKGEDNEEMASDLANYGVSALIPKDMIDVRQLSMLANAYADPLTARVQNEGSVVYPDPMNSNRSIKFYLEGKDKFSPIISEQTYRMFNGNTGEFETVTTKPERVGGSNLGFTRTEFFRSVLPQVDIVNSANYQNFRRKQAAAKKY